MDFFSRDSDGTLIFYIVGMHVILLTYHINKIMTIIISKGIQPIMFYHIANISTSAHL